MKNNNVLKGIKIASIIIAALIALVVYLQGIGHTYANQLADIIYQRGDLRSGQVAIIGIDERALEELGPYQTWTRDYVAEAIEILNADSSIAPAGIGVDVLYTGNTSKEEDEHLVNAAKLRNNVVFGSFLNIDSVLVEEGDGYSISDEVTLYEEPFEALKKASTQGFVNGFNDSDGIIRHGLQTVTLKDGRTIPSFSYALYKEYARANGLFDEIAIPTNSNGYWYIDYTDYAGGYDDGYSLVDILNGDVTADCFTDGIVLIGPYAEGLMDGHRAAIGKDYYMYGVEVHANMIESMIRGEFKKEIARGLMALIIAIATIIGVILCFQRRLWINIVYAVLGIVVYPIVCAIVYGKGTVLDVFYVPVFTAVITVVAVIAHYIRATLEKRKVEGTFKRYVAPEIVDEITKQGLETIKLGGEAVDCAILFVDIRGFTTMSEMLEPEQVVSILNKYLNLTSTAIFKYGGTLDKFIGDATMAIFGAPLPMDDYIYKAVLAAKYMVDNSEELKKELEEKYGRSVSFGVGVHCGKAVVGNIGTARRMDYTAIGDTVNTSARLEANAPKDTVYISKKVVDALGNRIKCESVGNIPLKGKSEELEVFKLIDVL